MLAAIFALVLTACPTDTTEKTKKETTLTISNNSNREIRSFTWNGQEGGNMEVGDTNTINIEPGSSYIYFMVYRGAKPPYPYWHRKIRTSEVISIIEGDKKIFTLLNSTIIIDIPTNKTYTFEEWAANPPSDGNWIHGG